MSAFDRQVGGDHFNKLAIQPFQYIMRNEMNFAAGNIVKYITRYKHKNGAEDIRKAIHYCQMLLEMEYGEKD